MPSPSGSGGGNLPVGSGVLEMKFQIPMDKRFVHEKVIPIRWSDVDANGHVNNVTYFDYFEVVRLDWLQSIGFQPTARGGGPVIIDAFCNFLQQIRFPGELLAKLYVADVSPSSFEAVVTLERVDRPGVVQAEGSATVIWSEAGIPLPATYPDWLRPRPL
jgi:acyl-CoA thioester hydrolase